MSLLLFGGLGVTAGAAPASATITTLCKGYTGCAKAGMSDAGYSAVAKNMYWRMYSGHNCTNYAAYRMIRAGYSATRPWTGSGNATAWGTKMAHITNSTPTVGSIAWWRAGVKPAGSAGHVAYVERVVSANEIIVSQDSWNGDFSWTRIVRSGTGWPSGFIHFRDAPVAPAPTPTPTPTPAPTPTPRLVATKLPTITGMAKVGSVLTASAGTWSQPGTTPHYQWMQNGAPISGATATTLTLRPAQLGKAITIRVTVVKSGFANTPALSVPTTAVLPAVLTSTAKPTIVGKPEVGVTLTVTAGSWSPAPDQLRYQWQARGVAIPGATSRSFTVRPEHAGAPLSVAVTAVRSSYPAVTTTTARSAAVGPGTILLRTPPSVRGTPRPGGILTVVVPEVPPQSQVAVQWIRGATPVPGATGRTYRLTAADAGSRLLAQVTVSHANYKTMSARTASSPVVRATPVIRVATTPGKRRLWVNASVTASGIGPAAGVLQVRSRGRVMAAIPLRNGTAKATVTVPRGKRMFRFRYVATSKVSGGLVERRIRIR